MAKKRKGEMSGDDIIAQIQQEGAGNASVQAQIQAELKKQEEHEAKLLAEQKKSTKAVEELVDLTKEEISLQKSIANNRGSGQKQGPTKYSTTDNAHNKEQYGPENPINTVKNAFKEAAMAFGNKAFNTAFPQFGKMLDERFEKQNKAGTSQSVDITEVKNKAEQKAEQIGTSNQILTTLVTRQEQTNLILEKVLKAIEGGGAGKGAGGDGGAGGGGGGGASIADALGAGGGGKGSGGGAASGSKPGFLSKAGGFIKGAAKGVGGLLGGMALDYASDKLTASGHEKLGAAASIGSSAVTGAGLGAMLGPAGAAVGGALGGAYGLYKNWGNLTGGPSKSADVAQAQSQARATGAAPPPPVAGAGSAKAGGPIISPSQSAGDTGVPAPSAAITAAQGQGAGAASPPAVSLGGPSPAANRVAAQASDAGNLGASGTQGTGTPGGTPQASFTPSGSSEGLKTGENGKLDPNSLTPVGGGHRLQSTAAGAYQAMVGAAKDEGINWGISDSYRTYDAQVKVAREKGLYSAGGLAATPGRSNHGWGTALDLDFKPNPKASNWLQQNAGRFGFSTIPREAWHWEYKGAGASGGSAMAQAKPSPIKTAEAAGEGQPAGGKKPETEGSKGADAGKFPALVGEKGSETVISKDGSKKQTGQGPKVAMLTQGDQVIPAFADGTTNAQPIDPWNPGSYDSGPRGPQRFLAMPGGSKRVKRYGSDDALAKAEGFYGAPTQELLNKIDPEAERIRNTSFGSPERNAVMSSDRSDILSRRHLADLKNEITGDYKYKTDSLTPDYQYNAQKKGEGWAAGDAERAQATKGASSGSGLKSLSEIDERNKRTSSQAITVNQNVESKPGSGGSNDSTSQVSGVEPADAKSRFKDLFHMGHR